MTSDGDTPQLPLRHFNRLSSTEAAQVLRPCLDVARWVAAVSDARPYDSVESLLATARVAAPMLSHPELEGALAHHPRIGQRATGTSHEATLSRSEQADLQVSDDVRRRLQAGNEAYEKHFGRTFLIRAAGRSAAQILTELESRLGNDPATEDLVVAEQLRQIALLRLAQAVSS